MVRWSFQFFKELNFAVKKKWTLLVIVVILIPLGFYSKFYSGPGSTWVNNSLGGILYVIFWSLLFSVIIQQAKSWKIVLIVLIFTCILEVLQLWHPPILESIRASFIGRALIGTSYSRLDLLHYLLGSIAAWGLLALLRQIE